MSRTNVRKRRKKRKVILSRFAAFLFMFSAGLYLLSSLFLRTYNNHLSAQVQTGETQIADLQTQNDALTVSIQTLSSRDRIDSIAADSGMSLDQENIVSISAAQE